MPRGLQVLHDGVDGSGTLLTAGEIVGQVLFVARDNGLLGPGASGSTS